MSSQPNKETESLRLIVWRLIHPPRRLASTRVRVYTKFLSTDILSSFHTGVNSVWRTGDLPESRRLSDPSRTRTTTVPRLYYSSSCFPENTLSLSPSWRKITDSLSVPIRSKFFYSFIYEREITLPYLYLFLPLDVGKNIRWCRILLVSTTKSSIFQKSGSFVVRSTKNDRSRWFTSSLSV